MGADNAHPKTADSERKITIARALMDLIETLRHPWSEASSKVFLNKRGDALRADSFRVDYWDRILAALKLRPRKFYATRHTFISEMVRKGINLKAVADYCGTSTAMIEQHYSAKLELDPDREIIGNSLGNSANSLASPTGFEPVLSA